jgi:UDP-sugar transporter A1/2/3
MLDTLKVALISAVYVVQNNLLFFAASNLDVGTFQVSYQVKILTGAIFFVLILDAKLTPTQWTAIVTLFMGVVMVKMADLETGGPARMPGLKSLNGSMVIIRAAPYSGREVRQDVLYRLKLFHLVLLEHVLDIARSDFMRYQ